MSLGIKRVYQPSDPKDGVRVLVDRLWPRGLTKDEAHVDRWMKDLAPSDTLRKWFGHDPAKWDAFRKRYLAELRRKRELVRELSSEAGHGHVTLLYGAKDEAHNNAVVLAEQIGKNAPPPPSSRRRKASRH
jgi:uncharacterized protein YeaO (DUF488 family)